MSNEQNDQLAKRKGNELTAIPPDETPVSRDNRQLWLLAIGVLGVLAILAGSYPRSVESPGYDSVSIDTVSVRAGGVNLIFVDSDGTEVQAELTGSRSSDVALNVTQTGTTLDVQVDRRFMFFRLFSFGQPTLTVSLPAGFDADIRAQISSGRIEIDNLRQELASVSLASSSGRVSITDTNFTGHVQVRTSSGRIALQQVATPGEFDLSASSGRIDVEDVQGNSYRFQTSSGRLTASGLSGAALNASTSSGGLNIQAATILTDWQLRSGSGSVTVELERPPGDLSVNFSGGSGSWRVADKYGFDTEDNRRNALVIRRAGPELSVRTGSGGFRLL